MDARCKAPDSISIHAAREGGDPAQAAQSRPQGEFQSTPPVKAATFSVRTQQTVSRISIHAAREGGDLPSKKSKIIRWNFNPRRP